MRMVEYFRNNLCKGNRQKKSSAKIEQQTDDPCLKFYKKNQKTTKNHTKKQCENRQEIHKLSSLNWVAKVIKLFFGIGNILQAKINIWFQKIKRRKAEKRCKEARGFSIFAAWQQMKIFLKR